MRDFQLNPGGEIDKGLPIELTRYGKTIAYVTDHNPEGNMPRPYTSYEKILNSSAISLSATPQQTYKREIFEMTSTNLQMCQIHNVYKQTHTP